MVRKGFILLALAVTLALPFLLRPHGADSSQADDTLVIITPHNEAIRHEFGLGFRRWYRARTGRSVYLDWRVIGGTSEINRYLDSEYVAAFQNYWTRTLGQPWSIDVQAGFDNGRLGPGASERAKAARAAFLASNVGCGIDLYFGGGTYDFERQSREGQLVPTRVFETHPEWFTDDVIPHRYAGQDYWDAEHRWVGNVLSNYGILYNRDAMARLGVDPAPRQWSDLADRRLIGEIALCDPTKSGSMATAFENLIQQQMHLRLHALQRASGGRLTPEIEAQAVREGWADGLSLIRLIGANARYFTDSSQKPPLDVAAGNCAAGICIDFYGRYQEEAVRRRDHSGRLVFVTPAGGTVSSVDPIGILRGAPHREVAEAFIEYTLTMEGQKLWNFRTGTPGGPVQFALRRLPVRRDYYTHQDWRLDRSDPDADPYAEAEDQLVYEPAWTGDLFREMAFSIRVMCLDTHQELVDAWKAVIAAGMPPRALAALNDTAILSYDRVRGPIKAALNAKDKVAEVRLANLLGAELREQYRRVKQLAAEGR